LTTRSAQRRCDVVDRGLYRLEVRFGDRYAGDRVGQNVTRQRAKHR